MGMFGFIMIFVVALTIAFVWLFWRVFQKAGYPGALGLLCLIPSVGPIVCMAILAFGTWPIETQRVAVTPVEPGVPMVPNQ